MNIDAFKSKSNHLLSLQIFQDNKKLFVHRAFFNKSNFLKKNESPYFCFYKFF